MKKQMLRVGTVVLVAGVGSMVAGCTPARETMMVRSSSAPAVAQDNGQSQLTTADETPVFRFGAGDGVGQSNYRIYRDEVMDSAPVSE